MLHQTMIYVASARADLDSL